jgi:hypothetical protein
MLKRQGGCLGSALVPVILATREGEIGRIKVQGKPRQKGHETPSERMTSMVVHTCHPVVWGSINRRTVVQACLNISLRPY